MESHSKDGVLSILMKFSLFTIRYVCILLCLKPCEYSLIYMMVLSPERVGKILPSTSGDCGLRLYNFWALHYTFALSRNS